MNKLRGLLAKKKMVPALFIILVIAALATSYYFYDKYKKAQNPTIVAKEEVASLTLQVGKLIELPNETPTIATVSDKNKLADQPFFERAQNGDKVLIFTDAKKAILFRPSINKIIEVAPLSLANTSPAPTGTAAAVTPKVYIFNGTPTTGLASKTKTELSSKTTSFEFVGVGDASKKDYAETLVVDVRGNNKNAAQTLAGLVNGKLVSLPSGEKAPQDADFLIILGK